MMYLLKIVTLNNKILHKLKTAHRIKKKNEHFVTINNVLLNFQFYPCEIILINTLKVVKANNANLYTYILIK